MKESKDPQFEETIIGDKKYIYILTKNGNEFFKTIDIKNEKTETTKPGDVE